MADFADASSGPRFASGAGNLSRRDMRPSPFPARRLAGFVEKIEEGLDDVDRHREDNGGVLFGADLGQGLQVAQLHGGRNAGKDLRGVDERLRSLELSLGMDDLGPPVALRLGLLGDGAHHVVRQLDGSDLNIADLDPPGLGLGVKDALHVDAELLPFGEHLVELMLPEHGTQALSAPAYSSREDRIAP